LKLLSEQLIDLDVRSPRLFFFEFNGARDHGLPILSRAAAIAARLLPKSGDLPLPKPHNLASQCRQRDSLPLAVGEQDLFSTQLIEKPSPFAIRNLLEQDWSQERTPEDNPLLVSV